MKKQWVLLLFPFLLGPLLLADTPPPGSLQIRGSTDGSLIGNTGNALNVNVIGGGGGETTVNQGMPAPAPSAWPVYMASPIPSQTVSVSNFPSPVPTQNVNVVNFPSPVPTQTVTGTVNIGNFPSTQNVNVISPSTLPVSGVVSVSNFPSPVPTQAVSGTVSVSNFPSPVPTQSVSVTNFPSVQSISGTVTSNIGSTNGLALDSSLSTISSKLPSTLGQKASAGSLGVVIASDQSAIPVTGTFTATNASIGLTGVTAPTSATEIAGVDSSNNLQHFSITAAGALKTDSSATTQPVSGSGNFTVVQPTGSNLHVDVDSGSVSVSNPITNYALETGGNLATIASDSASLPTIVTNTAAIATNVLTVNTTLGTTNTNTGNTAVNTSSILTNQTNGNQKTQVTSTVPPSDAVSTGTLTSMVSVLTIPANGIAEGGINVSGTFVGSIQVEGSITGGMYQILPTLQSGVWTTNPITAPGFYKFQGATGFQTVNALFTSYTSGTATVRLEGTTAVSNPTVVQSNAANLNATVVQSSGSQLHVNVDNYPSNQNVTLVSPNPVPVSAASLPLPSGAATSALQTTGNNSLASLLANQTNGNQETQVTNFPATQAVTQSGTWNLNNITGTVSLPTGAATSANQTSVIGSALGGTAASQSLLAGAQYNSTLPTLTQGQQTALQTDNNGRLLISGSITATNPSIGSTGSAVPTMATFVGFKDSSGNLKSVTLTSAGALSVDGSAVTQPVSGTVTANQGGTWNINNVSGTVSLPTGASTSALQTTGNSSLASILNNQTNGTQQTQVTNFPTTQAVTQSGTWSTGRTWSLSHSTDSISSWSFDGAGNALSSQVNGSQQALDVGIDVAGVQIDPRQIRALTSSDVVTAQQGGTWNLGNISGTISLPTGASTSANQSTIITDLGTVISNQTNGNQKNQVTNFPAIQAVSQSGTWNLNNITGTVSLPTGAATAANQTNVTGSANGGTAALNSLLVGGTYSSTLPTLTNGQQSGLQLDSNGRILISGNITATNPSIGSTNSTVPSMATFVGFKDGSGNLNSVTLTSAGALPIDGSGVTQPVSGTVTANQGGTWNLANITGTVSLPTGASTSANQSTIITDLSSILLNQTNGNQETQVTNFPSTLGVTQSTSPWVNNITQFGGSNVVTGTGVSGLGIPRVTISNDSNLLATQSGTWNLNNITGTISLPANAAQETGGNLAAISTNTSNINTSVQNTQGSALGGTTASQSDLVGGVYHSTAPTLTNGQQASLQLDSSGNLKTTSTVSGTLTVNQGTSPWVNNISQFGGANVVTGTGVSGSGIPRITVSNDSNILATQSGTWSIGLNSGSNNIGSITNITGTVSLPTGAATSTNQATEITDLGIIVTNTNALNSSQGSTTSGQNGPLIQGAVTTSAPSYTTAQTSPLSLNTFGGLRVDGSGVTQPVSGTVTANQGGTWNINNISGTVSLPTGAATNSELVTINTTLGSPFQAGGSIGNTTFASTQSGTWNLNNISGTISLPTGAATAANQTSVIGSVAAGTAATNSLLTGAVYNTSSPAPTNGQQVALQANASGSLKVDGSAVTQPVSGTVTANAGTGTFSVSDAITHTDLATINTTLGSPFQAGGSIGNTSFGATQSGTWNLNNITGTVSLPTGAATATNQTNVTGSTSGGTAAVNSLLAGGVYNSTAPTLTPGQQASLQLDASGNLKTNSTVSGTVTANQGTSPWVNNITQFGSNNVVTGTGSSGVGIPRVTVSNDSNILASQNGTWNINNVTGTVSLPTGASTSANQSTIITDLGNIASNQTNGTQLTTIAQGGNSATVSAANALKVDGSAVTQPVSGTVTTIAPSTSSASLTQVTNSMSSALVSASNSNRKGLFIYNNSTTSCNIAFAATASSTSFTFVLTTHSTYNMIPPIYQGAISEICNAATGSLQVTEF